MPNERGRFSSKGFFALLDLPDFEANGAAATFLPDDFFGYRTKIKGGRRKSASRASKIDSDGYAWGH